MTKQFWILGMLIVLVGLGVTWLLITKSSPNLVKTQGGGGLTTTEVITAREDLPRSNVNGTAVFFADQEFILANDLLADMINLLQPQLENKVVVVRDVKTESTGSWLLISASIEIAQNSTQQTTLVESTSLIAQLQDNVWEVQVVDSEAGAILVCAAPHTLLENQAKYLLTKDNGSCGWSSYQEAAAGSRFNNQYELQIDGLTEFFDSTKKAALIDALTRRFGPATTSAYAFKLSGMLYYPQNPDWIELDLQNISITEEGFKYRTVLFNTNKGWKAVINGQLNNPQIKQIISEIGPTSANIEMIKLLINPKLND
jgi:hypothetical protein